MVRVYINNKPLYFTAEKRKAGHCIPFNQIADFEVAIHLLKREGLASVNLYHPQIDEVWDVFQQTYTSIFAAGGLVCNPSKDYLLIYRNGLWDLPKGKMEKGENKEETALREVEEECGISGLKITKELMTTYHMYSHKGEWNLKVVYWFEMQSNEAEALVPQLEEGITKAEWTPKSELLKRFDHSYANIQALIVDYFS